MLVRILAMMIQKRVSHIAFSIQNDLTATDTSLRLVGYRYSTEGYYTLNEWASRRNSPEDFWETGNRRSRDGGTLTQSLGRDYGDLYLTLSRQQYWHTDDVETINAIWLQQ